MQQEKSKEKEEKARIETKNKKSKKDKEKQKKDKAWKKITLSPNNPEEKVANNITYHWCIHHMPWTIHKPKDCRFYRDQDESLKR